MKRLVILERARACFVGLSVLLVYGWAGMDSGADIAFWNTQMHLILEEVEGKTGDQAAATVQPRHLARRLASRTSAGKGRRPADEMDSHRVHGGA